jgi:hypothetical protein
MKIEQGVGMASTTDDRQPSDTPSVRGRKGKRRTSPASPSGGALRFFLSKAESNGLPLLEQELGSEPEAMLESLKTGRSYFVISEWKGSADLSKKVPQIRKESITAKRMG